MTKWSEHYKKRIDFFGGLSNYVEHKLHYKRALLNMVRKYANKKIVMEVGSGVGIALAQLSKEGFAVTGVDNDRSMIELAKSVAKYMEADITYCLDDLRKIDYTTYDFKDLVYSNGLMEHFSDNEIITIVNEQLLCFSTIIVSVPTSYFSKQDAINGDERFLSPDKWEEIISETKGEIVEFIGYDDRSGEVISDYTRELPRFIIMVIK